MVLSHFSFHLVLTAVSGAVSFQLHLVLTAVSGAVSFQLPFGLNCCQWCCLSSMCPTHPVTPYHYRCQHNDNQVLLLSPTLPTDLLWLHVCHTHPVTPYMIPANRMTTKFSSCPPPYLLTCYGYQQNDNQVFLLSYNTVMSQVPVYLFTCYSCQHEFCY